MGIPTDKGGRAHLAIESNALNYENSYSFHFQHAPPNETIVGAFYLLDNFDNSLFTNQQ